MLRSNLLDSQPAASDPRIFQPIIGPLSYSLSLARSLSLFFTLSLSSSLARSLSHSLTASDFFLTLRVNLRLIIGSLVRRVRLTKTHQDPVRYHEWSCHPGLGESQWSKIVISPGQFGRLNLVFLAKSQFVDLTNCPRLPFERQSWTEDRHTQATQAEHTCMRPIFCCISLLTVVLQLVLWHLPRISCPISRNCTLGASSCFTEAL